MAYNTNNPVGSTDPRDLYDNSGNLDKFVNGDQPFYPDRLGKQRYSWAGMEQDFIAAQDGRDAAFDQFLEASAFVWIGDYGPGLTFTSRAQYTVRDGYPYRLANATTLPYTTTGNWALEQSNFILVNPDDVLRQDLANASDADKGAAMIGRVALIAASIDDLLLQPRRPDLMYLVKGYYAGSPSGGGNFYWDSVSTDPDDFGSTLAVPGVSVGRFKRILSDGWLHTADFGIDHAGATSAVERLQSMINLEWPIWNDPGSLLIDRTLFYKNTTMRGPGVLKIVSDANFVVSADSPFASEACICPKAPISTGPTYTLNIDVQMTFDTYTLGKPTYPIRFARTRNSVIRINFVGTGHTAGVYTNAPDAYFDNREMEIYGSYICKQADPSTDQGGMWVRDVGFNGADSSTHFSRNVIVKSGTYIYNDGVDEALAFFCPSGGTMYNCGVEAATVEGGGLGLSFFENNDSNRSQERFDCFATDTKVKVNSLRASQPAVKFSKCVARVTAVTATIYGFRETATAGAFYAGFRNADSRTNAEYPVLIGCKTVLATAVNPASEVRAFDGLMTLDQCEIARLPGAKTFNYGVKNGATVQGGRWPEASTFTFDTVSDVRDPLPGSVTYNNVARRRGISTYKTESMTPDGSGNVTLTHSFGVNPTFAEASLENSTTRDVVIISRSSSTITARIIDRATGAAITSGSFTVIWKAQA